MGVFTTYENPSIDAQISSKLRLITKIILSNIPYVKSILLTGGFGKGEGSVKISKDGKITCLRDFDIVVITERIPETFIVQKLYDQIYRSLNLPNPEHKLFRFSNFVIDIKFLRKTDLIHSDIWFYDLKAVSHLLYGEDPRNSITCIKEDIPLSSGLRLLFEKVTGLLALFPYIGLDRQHTKNERFSKEKKELLIFECYKAFIEMGTALCIFAGKYEPRYADRAKNFKKLYPEDFPDLARVLPDLSDKVVACTNFKLKPNFAKISKEDITALWFTTRDYLSIVVRFYLEKFVGTNRIKWKDLPSYTKDVAWRYYKPFLKSILYRKLKCSNRLCVNFSSFLYQSLVNIEYSYAVFRDSGKFYFYPLRKFYISPSLKFFTAGTMLLFSLNREISVERNLFREAMETLRQCIPVKISSVDLDGWNDLRRLFLKAYSLYRGYHFVK